VATISPSKINEGNRKIKYSPSSWKSVSYTASLCPSALHFQPSCTVWRRFVKFRTCSQQSYWWKMFM